MSRQLTTAALAAVQGEVVERTIAVELLFSSGAVRYSGAPFDMTIDGNLFLGVGMLGRVAAVEESAELQSYGLTVGLSGIPRDVVAIALTEKYQGRRATVWEVPLSGGAVIASPIVIFRGRMDQMDIALGEVGEVTVRLENRLADWSRPRAARYTHEDQIARHPGDMGLNFVSATTEKELIWPARTFFR